MGSGRGGRGGRGRGARRLLVAEAAGRQAAVHVPSAAELAGRGLTHLLRGAEAAEADAGADRVRLHATLALALGAEGAGCAFEAQFFYRASDGRARALPLGCALVASGAHVRGDWGQCALILSVGVADLHARAAPAAGAPAACARGELLVFLAAHSTFAECETGVFPSGRAGGRARRGVCTPWRDEGVPGRPPPGFVSTRSAEAALCGPACGNCTEPEVEEGRAVFDATGAPVAELPGAESCRWTCLPRFFEVGEGHARRGVECGAPLVCPAGEHWRNWSAAADSGCVACPDLGQRQTPAVIAGDYATNEEYVAASGPRGDLSPRSSRRRSLRLPSSPRSARPSTPRCARSRAPSSAALRPQEAALGAAAGTRACRSRCVAGAFRDVDSLCKRCWPRALVFEEHTRSLQAGFFAFLACDTGRNTRAVLCEDREGAVVVHDPGTTGECQRACLAVWRANATLSSSEFRFTTACTPCAGVTVLDAQGT
jgi:hypothetical protein